jgi:hypothetical protein
MPQNLRLLISLLPTRRQYRLQHSARSRGQLLEMRFLSSARSCFGPKSEQLRPGPARARKVDFFRPDPARFPPKKVELAREAQTSRKPWLEETDGFARMVTVVAKRPHALVARAKTMPRGNRWSSCNLQVQLSVFVVVEQ